MIIFGWPIKVNWFLIFSQNISNHSCIIRSVSRHGGLFVAYWPSMTGSWGVRDAECRPLIGWWPRVLASDWSVMTSSLAPGTSITCPAGGQAPGPHSQGRTMRASHWSGERQCRPLIGCRGDIEWRQATWPTTGLAWTMGTRTLWESISDHTTWY